LIIWDICSKSCLRSLSLHECVEITLISFAEDNRHICCVALNEQYQACVNTLLNFIKINLFVRYILSIRMDRKFWDRRIYVILFPLKSGILSFSRDNFIVLWHVGFRLCRFGLTKEENSVIKICKLKIQNKSFFIILKM